jgi:peptidoglycan/LPS O-acetylase OafA/YrhL
MKASAPRIAALDALRGLAALAIVVHHYWFLARPLQATLGWVYEYGRLAVPLFYLLSGYIFFSAYAAALGERRLDGRAFFWLRASRLYPLHLLTLLVVLGLQALIFAQTGGYFQYRHNDAVHFALNLAFLQFSWADPLMSFNGPTWSLSIEAALYLTFFAFARAFGAAAWPRLGFGALCLALSAGRDGLPLSGPLNAFFAEGLGCFFLGGALQLTEGCGERRKLALGVALLALGAGLFWLTGGRRETTPVLFAGLALTALAGPGMSRLLAFRPLVWLGDISYSTYLWHFPVQLALVAFSAAALPLPFASPALLALYVGLVLAVSTLSYRYFEAPARAAIRRWALARRPAPALRPG